MVLTFYRSLLHGAQGVMFLSLADRERRVALVSMSVDAAHSISEEDKSLVERVGRSALGELKFNRILRDLHSTV